MIFSPGRLHPCIVARDFAHIHSSPSETNALKQGQRTWLRERKPNLQSAQKYWCPVGAVSQVPEHQTYLASLRRDNRDLRGRTAWPHRACRIARWLRYRSARVECRHLQAPMQSRMRRLPAATDRLDVDRRQSSMFFIRQSAMLSDDYVRIQFVTRPKMRSRDENSHFSHGSRKRRFRYHRLCEFPDRLSKFRFVYPGIPRSEQSSVVTNIDETLKIGGDAVPHIVIERLLFRVQV